ncbi:MAG: glycosyltransferase family 2 protein [Candidatus Cloacimonetes bacterium]|nr:glycosyltransferase family 2 protein [Candidatus Cloacimonadota bacterium]
MITPLVTIITVSLNSESTIRETIESVLNQTYPNIEYIIIDGRSTDETVEIIKRYEPLFSGRMKWISEKDNGIYDAMNKGINLASGEWINFMNSGDWFYSSNVISEIFYKDHSAHDLIYGNHEIRYDKRYNGFTRTQKAGKLSDLYKGMIFSHQSLFCKREIFSQIDINNSSFKIANDYNFIIKAYKNNKVFKKIDLTVSSILAGGLSDNGLLRLLALWENFKIARTIRGFSIIPYYIYRFVMDFVFTFAQKVISPKYQIIFIKGFK